jgi:Trypsin
MGRPPAWHEVCTRSGSPSLVPRSTATLAAILAALGALCARPAAGLAQTVTVYINRDGGSYTPGEPNDSAQNISSVPQQTLSVPAWDGSEEEWQDLVACVDELFSPFDIEVTDVDPGDASHLEAVIGGDPVEFGLMPTVAGVSPFLSNCGVIDDSIVFVFPSVVGGDPRRLCETVAQEVAHSFGLDHQYLCEDPMTYLAGCGDKQFLFQESVCGEFEPRDCKCTRTQNSAQMLLDRVGRGSRPAIWLAQPSPGDLLAAGFPVQAAVTHAPTSLELFVDGVLFDTAAPRENGEAYQLVDFDTLDSMRSGTHHVELVAHYGDDERSVSALVEVEGVESQNVVSEGCAAGGGGGGAAAGLFVVVIGLLARRAGQAAMVATLALALGQAACETTVFGQQPDDIESGCPAAGDVGDAIGVLWSQGGGTCTASLVEPNAVVTAAHCVDGAAPEDDPIVTVLGGRQYIASQVVLHPDWEPGAQADDVATVILSREVVGVDPLVLAAEEPADGSEVTLVGHGEWSPAQAREAERQAQVAEATDVQDRVFSYDAEVEDGCLVGRGGGPVFPAQRTDRLLGLQGEDRRVMRMDQYACFLACAAGVPESVPGGCGCEAGQP